MLHATWAWFTENGVGQNITASFLIAVPTTIWARWKLVPRVRDHVRRVAELHRYHLGDRP